MAGTLVDHRFVCLTRLFHQLRGLRHRRIHARIIAAVEAIHRAGDASDLERLLRPATVKDERRFDVCVVGRIAERLSSAPAEPADSHAFVAGRQAGGVLHDGVQIGGDLVGWQRTDGPSHRIAAPQLTRSTTAWSSAGEQVGCNGDIARLRQLIGNASHPVGESEDLVNHNDRGRLILHLGIRDERVQRAISVLDLHPFQVPRRLLQSSQCPFLRRGNVNQCGEEGDSQS